ncbi:hypothetical protein [Pseudidiomarina insulisalsae]|uniref:Uncharacterized protein n=1 Tax=Pseudidiomarina insulisalsae TaxID=575789 RepID=A0A432YNI4_9GAMM|nr:hypothetical protein [Pseudidiomarina insulisalsae]RUO62551.1 hypothetical protein CWI71_03720 [Pseudidiomarina insulisalsae]
MKHYKNKLLLSCAALPLLCIEAAQAEQQTYIFNGILTQFDSTFFSQAANDSMDQFTLTLIVETTAVLVYADPETEVYTDAVIRFDTGSSGPNGGVWTFPTPTFHQGSINEISYSKTGGIDELTVQLDFEQQSWRYVEYLTVTQASTPFIGLNGTFPGVLNGQYEVSVSYEAQEFQGETMTWRVAGQGFTTSVIGTLFDSDFDGVTDEIDLCPASIKDETVVFNGWYDSGVPNYVDESGCTIMDHYAVCLVEEEEEQEPSRFSWVQPTYSGPSYCEKQVAYGLVSDGVIDFSESRTLRRALYDAYRSGGIR